MSQLAVIVDGRALPEPEARTMWTRFSTYMDEHQGDFDGFAASEGCVTAEVAVVGGAPTLKLTTSASDTAGAQESSIKPVHRNEKKGGRKQHRAPARRDDGRGGSEPPRRKR